MGIGTLLLRAGFYSGLVSLPIYFYSYSDGFDRGQLDGFKKGYSQCEVVKQKEITRIIDRSYTAIENSYKTLKSSAENLKGSYESIDAVCDDAKSHLSELIAQKERSKRKASLQDSDIKQILERNGNKNENGSLKRDSSNGTAKKLYSP